MDVCLGVLVLLVILLVIFAVVLARSDGDLVLMCYEHFCPRTRSLCGKVVWVTGASSGIGRGLAVKLAALRCRLVISARRKHELDQVKDECIAVGLKDEDVLVLPLDLTDIARHEESLRTVLDHFGKLDILVNNAGRSQRANFEDVDIQVDRELFEVNLFSQVALTTTVLRQHFLDRKAGHFVVTSSAAGKIGVPSSRSYNGSKHALHGYFECLAVEHPFLDITMVCPGPIVSEISVHAFTARPNEVFGKRQSEKDRMPVDRCAHLMAVAIANRLAETWISPQPALMLFYLSQYTPWIIRPLLRRLGTEYLNKQRDGDIVPEN